MREQGFLDDPDALPNRALGGAVSHDPLVRAALPSGTVTFLFTDVEGSTRLLEELGPDRYAVALADHRRIVREACVSLGGVEVDTQADAFLVAFARAPDALQAATVITERLEEEPIRVRMGLHTGTPLVTVRGGGSASCGPDRGGGPWRAGAGERVCGDARRDAVA